MKEQEREVAEQEERSRNIIIFRAEESKKIRKDECERDESKFISGFLEKVGMDHISFDKIERLGQKSNEKCRPLRFRVEDSRNKTATMEKLFHLKEAGAPYAKISVRHDLTPTQREELKKMIQEAKDQSEETEHFLFLVRSRGAKWDPRIIRVKRREAAQVGPKTQESR